MECYLRIGIISNKRKFRKKIKLPKWPRVISMGMFAESCMSSRLRNKGRIESRELHFPDRFLKK